MLGDSARAIAQYRARGLLSDHHALLRHECARAAKRPFRGRQLARDPATSARDRIDFYDRRVLETAERIEREFAHAGSTPTAPTRCGSRSSSHFIGLLIDHKQPECAETFFNSVSCKILHRDYFHNRFIFVRPAISTEHIDADPPSYRSYYPLQHGLARTR